MNPTGTSRPGGVGALTITPSPPPLAGLRGIGDPRPGHRGIGDPWLGLGEQILARTGVPWVPAALGAGPGGSTFVKKNSKDLGSIQGPYPTLGLEDAWSLT